MQCGVVRLCIFGFEGKVCFAPSTFLPDATSLQLYNFMEKSWFQRRKTFLLLLKITLIYLNGITFNGSESSLLAQNLELWLLNTNKNSLRNLRLQCLSWHLNLETTIRTSLDNCKKSDGSASGLAVQLQLLTVAETFVEDAVEEILSSIPLGRDGTSQPSSAPEPKRQWDGNNKCLLTLSALLHQLLQIRHIHTKVICFTCYFTLDHCIFLPGNGLVCL